PEVWRTGGSKSASPGNSRVVHGGFCAPTGEVMRFISSTRGRAYNLESLFYDVEEAKAGKAKGVQHHILNIFLMDKEDAEV
ncbi:MAG: hypothetical protein LBJ90_07695, partial [Treponema sp.]|nr:hypothetical protein [Treponema sp.]